MITENKSSITTKNYQLLELCNVAFICIFIQYITVMFASNFLLILSRVELIYLFNKFKN